jgi:ATP-dependent Clp protease ATP-binding subunit ClpC
MNWLKKFLAKLKSREPDSHELLDNFTPRAKKVMAFANEEALHLKHNFIGTEHILLGLVKLGDGVAANVLIKLGLTLEKARMGVEKIDGLGPDRKITFTLPFTPRAKEVFKLARNDAKLLNHTYIGTEHILLGILYEGQGIAAKVLRDFNIDIKKMREEILNELNPHFLSGSDAQEKQG